MKANELRIGNKFILPNGEIGTVSYHEIRLLTIGKPDYNPIPLTEEWLLKFGLEKFLGIGDVYELELFDYGYFELTEQGLIATFQGQQISKAMKYVHEFQNYISSSTESELTLKQ